MLYLASHPELLFSCGIVACKKELLLHRGLVFVNEGFARVESVALKQMLYCKGFVGFLL